MEHITALTMQFAPMKLAFSYVLVWKVTPGNLMYHAKVCTKVLLL